MKALHRNDESWLTLENRRQPTHVGCVCIFQIPEGEDRSFVSRLAKKWMTYQAAQAPYNQKLIKKRGRFYWDEDYDFEIENHFLYISLPGEGTLDDLQRYISSQHTNLMDRSVPMWQLQLIDGVENNQFAFYFKQHHCIADGVGCMQQILRSFSLSVEDLDMPPMWGVKKKSRKKGSKTILDTMDVVSNNYKAAWRLTNATPKLAKEIWRGFKSKKEYSDLVPLSAAPECILSQPVTPGRRFVAMSIDMKRLKRISKHYKCSLNDVILSVLGGGLRDYLIDNNDLPKQSIVSAVPVSLKEKGSDEGGNNIGLALTQLGTNIADPAERIQAVIKNMNRAKEFGKSIGPEAMGIYVGLIMSGALVHGITGAKPNIRMTNTVISNVPGAQEPMYLDGARLNHFYPTSLVVHGAPLNITIVSYDGSFEIGFMGCRKSVSNLKDIIPVTEKSMAALEATITD